MFTGRDSSVVHKFKRAVIDRQFLQPEMRLRKYLGDEDRRCEGKDDSGINKLNRAVLLKVSCLWQEMWLRKYDVEWARSGLKFQGWCMDNSIQ